MRLFALVMLAGCFSKPPFPADIVDGRTNDGSASSDGGVKVSRANFVFTTQQTWSAMEIGGRAGADLKCRQAALDGGLAGTYFALVGTTNGADAGNAMQPLTTVAGFVRVDDRPIAATLDDLALGHHWYPVDVDEHGNRVGDDVPVWTGTASTGVPEFTCADWMSDQGFGWAGRYDAVLGEWFSMSTKVGCGTKGHLYCAEADRTTTITGPVDTGLPYVFVGTGTAIPANNWSSEQFSHCTDEGHMLDPNGTFAPLVATAVSAAQVSSLGPSFQRPDHTVVTIGGRLGSPIAQTFDKTFVEVSVFTGATDESTASTANCGGWLDSASSAVIKGRTTYSNSHWFDDKTGNCNDPGVHIYCIEQSRN